MPKRKLPYLQRTLKALKESDEMKFEEPKVYRSVTLGLKLPSLAVKKIRIQLNDDSWHEFGVNDLPTPNFVPTNFAVETIEPEPTRKRKFRKPMEEKQNG